MTTYIEMLEWLKLSIAKTEFGAIIILTDGKTGHVDVEMASNLSRVDQAKLLRDLLGKIERGEPS